MIKGSELRRFCNEQIIFILIATAAMLHEPALVKAENTAPSSIFFTEPLTLSRGKLSPISHRAQIVSKETWCDYAKKNWGWSSCDGIDAFIVGYDNDIDTIIINEPNNEGHVSFDDWKSNDVDEQIHSIEDSLKDSLKEQGERIHKDITFKAWRVYPTLNEKLHVMYYAVDTTWDGDLTTNIKATIFDRSGYLILRIIPDAPDITKQDIEKLIFKIVNSYRPNDEQYYDNFQSGDKVAAVGALGILATVLGVKYGKTFFAVIIGTALLLLKKAWFLLMLPFVAIKKLFTRKKVD